VRSSRMAKLMRPGGTFTAVSYNIHQCVGLDGRRDVARIARVLCDLHAQLIGLQEVGTDLTAGRTSSQMDYLAEATGLQAIAGPTIERQTGPFGNVLLTSWRVLDSRLIDLSVPGREPRGAIDADLMIEARPVRVIVTHLGLQAAERRYQVRRLLEVLSKGQNRSIIMLGDINEWILRSRPLGWLYARFGTPPAPRTYPSWLPLFALDRIWVLPREELIGVRACAKPLARIASDHLPVRGLIATAPLMHDEQSTPRPG
jgi:endonuclease/exonuclease/phosphatase family metal-dependent hydrolase